MKFPTFQMVDGDTQQNAIVDLLWSDPTNVTGYVSVYINVSFELYDDDSRTNQKQTLERGSRVQRNDGAHGKMSMVRSSLQF